ncbi:MAG: acyl transferase [Bacteroidetes bacterium]|nr:acyl transferase [Bacteroidota bacterium]
MRDIFNRVWSTDSVKFNTLALEIFHYQRHHNVVFAKWLSVNGNPEPKIWTDIPFIPIDFFKDYRVASFEGPEAIVFESSGTGHSGISKHFLQDPEFYICNFRKCFELQYGQASQFAWMCLLPGYLERKNSSLVFMADDFVKYGLRGSDFYLYDFPKLIRQIETNEQNEIPGILLGVTFALQELAKVYKGPPLRYTTIMETGGMKGRGPELTRAELHKQWCTRFGVSQIHSEYGMTELMSQAYSQGNGRYVCPPWMKIMIRDISDPGNWLAAGKTGIICVVDLANIQSCSFIATQDLGKIHEDGSFEVLGRHDQSDARGCNLLVSEN